MPKGVTDNDQAEIVNKKLSDTYQKVEVEKSNFRNDKPLTWTV